MKGNESNDYKAWITEEQRKKLYKNSKTWDRHGKPIIPIKKVKRVKAQVNNYSPYVKVKKAVYVVSRKRNFDFLKYWSLVRHWAIVQYGITQEEIDTLMYLYSEPYFSRDQYNEFADVLMGKKNSLTDFINRGYIVEIDLVDKTNGEKVSSKQIYKLSFKMNSIMSAIYDRVLLKTQISESNKITKVFQVFKTTIKDRKVAKLIVKMNETAKSIQNGADKTYIKDDLRKSGEGI
jgi:hypothetical protein